MKFQMLQILQQEYRMNKEQHLSEVEEFCLPIKFSHTKILCAKHFIARLDYWKKKRHLSEFLGKRKLLPRWVAANHHFRLLVCYDI